MTHFFAPAFSGINPARRYKTVGVTQSEADKIFSRWIRNPLPEGDPGPHNFGDNRGEREIPDQWNGKTQYHASMDTGHEFGQEVYPLAPGKVVFTGLTGMGNTVVIEHTVYGIKLYSVYGHFGENGNAEIYTSPGATVSYNDVIGLTGNSKPDCANCSPHLHFEVRYPANINLGNPKDVLSGMRYWAFEGEDWHLYFYDLGQIWGYDPDNFGNP